MMQLEGVNLEFMLVSMVHYDFRVLSLGPLLLSFQPLGIGI